MDDRVRTLALSALTVAALACSKPTHAGDETTDAKPAETASAGPRVDKALPPYQKVEGEFSGTLNAVGSDTMINIVTNWGEAFGRIYPGVKVQVEGKGSSTAPPALIAGSCQLGPMSREMKPEELS